jgi:hypothetical protein
MYTRLCLQLSVLSFRRHEGTTDEVSALNAIPYGPPTHYRNAQAAKRDELYVLVV